MSDAITDFQRKIKGKFQWYKNNMGKLKKNTKDQRVMLVYCNGFVNSLHNPEPYPDLDYLLLTLIRQNFPDVKIGDKIIVKLNIEFEELVKNENSKND